MQTVQPARARKRPVNLLLNEVTVQQARHFSTNLWATVDALLADYVARQIDAQRSRELRSDAVAEAWNRFNAEHGCFADEYSTL